MEYFVRNKYCVNILHKLCEYEYNLKKKVTIDSKNGLGWEGP